MQIKFPSENNSKEFSIKAFLWEQKERVLMGLLILVVGAFFLARGTLGKEKRLGEYFQAGVMQSKLRAQKEVDPELLAKLLKKHGELKPLFARYLEQAYILEGNVKGAKDVSEEVLKRLSFIDPLYSQYARVSLLIEEGKYEEALEKSLQMKSEIKQESSPNLYGLNLVRVAFLETVLKRSQVKWEEIKEILSNELYTHFSDEKLSLLDFAASK